MLSFEIEKKSCLDILWYKICWVLKLKKKVIYLLRKITFGDIIPTSFCFLFSGQTLCRIEEEHLWESKQLGAHSPYVLLNTLIYFHTKHFILKTAEEHMSLSFAQIVKHLKKGVPGKCGPQNKNVALRYYCLANSKNKGEKLRFFRNMFYILKSHINHCHP